MKGPCTRAMLTMLAKSVAVCSLACGAPVNGAAARSCPGDVTGDRAVDVDDLLAVINSWGHSPQIHEVLVWNYEFVPAALAVRVGDRVQWVLQFGLHTVTSGGQCSADGRFNGVVSGGNPMFAYEVAPSDVGVLEYFCDPHCHLGMTGLMAVERVDADVTGEGAVNVDDLLMVINAWGACG